MWMLYGLSILCLSLIVIVPLVCAASLCLRLHVARRALTVQMPLRRSVTTLGLSPLGLDSLSSPSRQEVGQPPWRSAYLGSVTPPASCHTVWPTCHTGYSPIVLPWQDASRLQIASWVAVLCWADISTLISRSNQLRINNPVSFEVIVSWISQLSRRVTTIRNVISRIWRILGWGTSYVWIVVSKNKVRLEHSYKVRSEEKGIHVLCSGFCICR